MNPWEFLLSIFAGFCSMLALFWVLDRWAEGRARDRRVEEWTRMVLEKQKKRDWATRTYRDHD